MRKTTTPVAQQILVFLTIAAWILLALSAPWQSLAEDKSTAVAVVLNVWGWLLWTATTVAVLVRSPLSLTVLRIVSPLAVICSLAAVHPLAVFASVVAYMLTQSSLLCDSFVQGGAYGAEIRFSLRTPVPYMAPTVVAWAVLCGSTIGGSLLIAAQNYVVGVPVALIGVLLLRTVPRRLHRLARRWLVIVPSGIVVHDHMVLAETLMVPKAKLKSHHLVAESGEAADFTGMVSGPRIEIQMTEADKVVLSPITAKNLGTTEALHVLSFSIAPRNISAAMAAITK